MAHAYRGPFIVLVMSFIGFILALIEQMAFENGYLVDQYVTSSSMLVGLEVLTIIVAILAGCVIAAATQ
jgi:hypothetical protein